MLRARTPTHLGRYRVVERLGEGGMAVVYKALLEGPQGLASPFVLKRIRPQLARDPSFVKLFLAEARLTAMLRHPAIAQVHELGEADGEYFLVLEYIDGHDLSRLVPCALRLGIRLPLRVVAYVAGELLAALSYAHEFVDAEGRPLEIVHRDVSPSNVMLTRQGTVKLLDFGVAKAASHIRDERTRTGTLKGKISYLSPEQVEGLPVDHRSDLFALGIVLHELLTARRLFRGLDDFATMRLVREAKVAPPSLERAEVPPALDEFVLRLLARDAGQRFQHAAQALAALRPLLHALHGDAEGVRAFLGDLGPIPIEPAAIADAATRADSPDAANSEADLLERRPRTAPFSPRAAGGRRWGIAVAAVCVVLLGAGGWRVLRSDHQAPSASSVHAAVEARPVAPPPAPAPEPSRSEGFPPLVAGTAPPRESPPTPALKRSTSRRVSSTRGAGPSPAPSARPTAPEEPGRRSEIKDPFEP